MISLADRSMARSPSIRPLVLAEQFRLDPDQVDRTGKAHEGAGRAR